MKSAKITQIWRYPVKSMIGEELNACEITEKGLLADRAYGIIDMETGKLANAKNPLKWPNMFQYEAAFTKPPALSSAIPPVRVTLPNESTVLSTDETIDKDLSESFNRSVKLANPSTNDVQFEGYIPTEVKELEGRGTVFTRTSPAGTFFDIAMVHIISTSTMNYLSKITPDSEIDSRRFRPNIVIDVPDIDGFIENEWVGKVLKIGDEVKLRIIQGTKRCIMTTLAQEDLPEDRDVLRSIVKNNGGDFGVYAEVISTGTIQIGDRVEIIEGK